jgi:hypothetical protein
VHSHTLSCGESFKATIARDHSFLLKDKISDHKLDIYNTGETASSRHAETLKLWRGRKDTTTSSCRNTSCLDRIANWHQKNPMTVIGVNWSVSCWTAIAGAVGEVDVRADGRGIREKQHCD